MALPHRTIEVGAERSSIGKLPDRGFGSPSALLIASALLLGNIASNINLRFGVTLTHLFPSFTVSMLTVRVGGVAFAYPIPLTATDSRGLFV